MVPVLGTVYYCLRRRQEEKHKKVAVAGGLKNTIIKLIRQQGRAVQLVDSGNTPKASKGNSMEARMGQQAERKDCELGQPSPDSQTSVA
ncbi:extracellular leucine-rich repeat and [Lynx pardinus]|uniref:Extracellular leucine-rich repeat and n=1 Tax=Lynx pardinus TaxID=191816 RepID=A0A485MDW5_LYNPA|nr:extracellular leucine-rich repeat and [Lynx pardinus]